MWLVVVAVVAMAVIVVVLVAVVEVPVVAVASPDIYKQEEMGLMLRALLCRR